MSGVQVHYDTLTSRLKAWIDGVLTTLSTLSIGEAGQTYKFNVATDEANNQNIVGFYNNDSVAPKTDFFTDSDGSGVWRVLDSASPAVVRVQLSAKPTGLSFVLGNFGIGTANPASYQLEVKTPGNSNQSVFSFSDSDSLLADMFTSGSDVLMRMLSSGVKIQFHTNGNSYFNGGNVGIGTDAPTELLSVAEKFHVNSSGIVSKYDNVSTTGLGVPAIYGTGRSEAQNGAVASVVTYTPTSDGSFIISTNVNVTTYVAGTITVLCDYTDETGTARTFTFNLSSLAGVLGTTAGATGPFEGLTVHIRAKASTAIKIYTTVVAANFTYNVEGSIIKIA